eukprot:9767472-Alexandrium_andersonii.AAC.1
MLSWSSGERPPRVGCGARERTWTDGHNGSLPTEAAVRTAGFRRVGHSPAGAPSGWSPSAAAPLGQSSPGEAPLCRRGTDSRSSFE